MAIDWATVAAVLLAQVVLIGADWARHWIARKQRRQDARDDFQKQSMIELQESLYRLVRALSHAVHEYKLSAVDKLPPVRPTLEDPRVLGAGVFARIDALTVRVDDDEVRGLVRRYLDKHGEMFLESEGANLETFEVQLRELQELQQQANERIGRLLRRL